MTPFTVVSSSSSPISTVTFIFFTSLPLSPPSVVAVTVAVPSDIALKKPVYLLIFRTSGLSEIHSTSAVPNEEGIAFPVN